MQLLQGYFYLLELSEVPLALSLKMLTSMTPSMTRITPITVFGPAASWNTNILERMPVGTVQKCLHCGFFCDKMGLGKEFFHERRVLQQNN